MKVLVNALRPLRGGIAVYLEQMIAGFAARDDLEVHVACGRGVAEGQPSGVTCHAREVRPAPLGFFRERATLARLCGELRPDVLFTPIPLAPGRVPCPTVTTVHDLNFKFIPIGRLRTCYRKLSFASMARRSAALVAISEHTREVLNAAYPATRSKTSVVWNGFRAPDALPAIEALAPDHGDALAPDDTDDDRAPFLLGFAHWPHKNPAAAVRVLAELGAELPRLRLRVVGVGDEDGRRLTRLATELGVADRLDLSGLVGEAELEGLYARTLALIFLSEYEGFGLPVFEAMAMGRPVVASDRGALPEVVGGHAAVVPVDGWRAASDHVRRHLRDPAWSIRVRCAARDYVAQWTWKRAVEGTVAVMRSALNTP